jgi:hypothetical protein
MKASILFGACWENDSVEVLWRDPGRLFCRLWRNDAQGEKHAFVPILSEAGHPVLENVNRLAHEFELREHQTVRRRCGRWNSCASADRRCWLSSTPGDNPSIA